MTFDLPAEVRNKLVHHGAERWADELPALVRDVERDWRLSVGEVLTGGSEAMVALATTDDGGDAVVKFGVPGPTGFEQEICALLAADGRGYVRLLRHDTARRVMLQERLGPQLAQLQLPIRDQIEIICATLKRSWIHLPDDVPLMTGAEKARWLGEFISATWRTLDRPCSERAVECALIFSQDRQRAFDAASSVLVHGDAHSQNLLQRIGAVATDVSAAFKFVDPDGLRAEPAADLASPMRDWSEELLAGDALALGHARCEFISGLTGIAAEPIWQWGFMERMSTGLYLMQLGWHDEGRGMLAVADLWAE